MSVRVYSYFIGIRVFFTSWRGLASTNLAMMHRAHTEVRLHRVRHFQANTERYRWQVELFFKWIKQHLRIKSFFGTSENAVKSQIWIAVTVYVLVAVVKKRLSISADLYTILQVLSLTLFEKMPIFKLFSDTDYNLSNVELVVLLPLGFSKVFIQRHGFASASSPLSAIGSFTRTPGRSAAPRPPAA